MTGSVRRAAIAATLLATSVVATSVVATSLVAAAGFASVAGSRATGAFAVTGGLASAGAARSAASTAFGSTDSAPTSSDPAPGSSDPAAVTEGLSEVAVVDETTVAPAGAAADFTLAKYAKNSKKSKKRYTKKKSSGTVAPPLTGGVRATAIAGDAATEAQVNTLISAERTANGCRAMRTDVRLTAAARAHSSDMVTKNFFSHTGSDGSDFVARESRAGYVNASAENIAWGWSTAATVVKEWMNSPGHRANILNCGNIAVGVGLVRKADGTPYWTQDFGRV